MWSKAGRFVDGIHVVGDIRTKISTNCVINLHVALLFMYLFHGFIICAIITVYMFMGISCICCMIMFTVISV